MTTIDAEPMYPALDGSLTIPETIEFHFKHNAAQPAYKYSEENSPNLTVIRHLEFGRACHRAAHAIRPGRVGQDGQVVAIIALVDTIVYQAVTVGLMKAGMIPFPISPRNSAPAIINLLKKSSCHTILATKGSLAGLINDIEHTLAEDEPSFELTVLEIPNLSYLYPKLGYETPGDTFEPYPYPTHRPKLTDVAMYLHSSGSSGFPKCIPQTHLILLEWVAFSMYKLMEYRPRLLVACMALPAFHTLGIYSQLLQPLYGVIGVAVYPPVVRSPNMQPTAPTSDNILDHLRRTKANALVIVPALLHVWAQSEEATALLKDLVFVRYAGGPLAEKLGDKLAEAGVNVKSVYGGTEFGAPSMPQLKRGFETEWQWVEFSDRTNINWVPQGDGSYECQFLTVETHHPAVENMEGVKGYATSDLFIRHPVKPNMWKIVGRVDDVIIHSSSEKTVPGPMEEIMMSSPIIRGVIMFGRNHDQAGVLIEPHQDFLIDTSDQSQVANLRNKLWPIIEEANKDAPGFSKIYKEMMLITPKDKPLPRSLKGTVMRKTALQNYAQEIEKLYATVESTTGGDDVTPPVDWQQESIRKWLLDQARDIVSGYDLSPSKDLFEQGFDSLSATFLRLRIAGALRSSKEVSESATAISQNTVYSYPTIDNLATFIFGIVTNSNSTQTNLGGKDAIEEMIKKYSSGLDQPLKSIHLDSKTPLERTVLITGSTGFVGSQILAGLLEDESVKTVFALNRPPSGIHTMVQRHEARFLDKGLKVNLLLHPKLILLEGDASSEKLGLSDQIYDEIRRSATLVIHGAWRLDFNLTLPSFEANIHGTRNLIDLARSSPFSSHLRFLFISSVSSAQSWHSSLGPYPEELVLDSRYAVGGGYGASKYVTERILAQSGLEACSLRVGQVSGGRPNGAWATSDWVPIIIKSSIELGVLPNPTGVVPWIPMDSVAQATLDIAFSESDIPFAVNLVHPHPVRWSSIISSVNQGLEKELATSPLRIVSFQEWFNELNKRAESAKDGDLAKIPAIKLINFFRGMAHNDEKRVQAAKSGEKVEHATVFELEKAQKTSRAMANLKPIGDEDVIRWLKYWRASGFL